MLHEATEKDVKFYLRQLKLADTEESKWRTRAKKIVKRYRDEDPDNANRYNILWSNTQTQFPAMYSAQPKPDVRRRYRTENKAGRDIATAIERGLEFSMDSYDFDRMAEKATLDFLLVGRMTARVKYHPTIIDREESYSATEDTEGAVQDDEGAWIFKKKFSEVIHEEVRAYHVPWKHYRQSPAECWDDVWWVAYGDNFLTQEDITDQFGSEHDNVPLNFTDSDADTDDKDDGNKVMRAQVWELWDKDTRKVVGVIEGYDEFLMNEDDPLKLKNFYPQPEPALMIETSDSLIPIPEYTMYQFQAEELNEISARIASLVSAMQAKGLYPGEDADKINELMKSSENVLIPVDNYAAFAEKGGLAGMIEWMPIKEIAEVWQRLLVQRKTLSQEIYELIGISDIQRGQTDPRETKGAQQLKANFASRRLLPKQQRTQRYLRDLIRIKAEIMSEHFSSKTLSLMTGVEVTDEMKAIMRSDALRTFTIDIETDSTIAIDEEKEKAGVAEFLSAMSQYLQSIMPIVEANPAAMEPLGKMLLWMTRKFNIARDVEQEIEDFVAAFSNQGEAADAEAEAEAEAVAAEAEALAQQVQVEQQRKDKESDAGIARKDAEAQAEIRRKDALADAELRAKGIGDQKAGREIAILDAKVRKERGENVVPINSGFRIIRDEEGQIAGAELASAEGGSKTLKLQRENGKVVGGSIVS